MFRRIRSAAPSLVRANSIIEGADRVAGDGESMPFIMRSTSSSADSGLFGCRPMSLRTIRRTAPVNFSQPDILPPSTRVRASAVWNSGLLKASATNSSRLAVPYTSPICSRTVLKIACSCFTSGSNGFANDAEVAAWVISCRTVCTFIPFVASMEIVFVAGSYKPAAVRPTVCDRSSTTCTFVVPTTSASLAAI